MHLVAALIRASPAGEMRRLERWKQPSGPALAPNVLFEMPRLLLVQRHSSSGVLALPGAVQSTQCSNRGIHWRDGQNGDGRRPRRAAVALGKLGGANG